MEEVYIYISKILNQHKLVIEYNKGLIKTILCYNENISFYNLSLFKIIIIIKRALKSFFIKITY